MSIGIILIVTCIVLYGIAFYLNRKKLWDRAIFFVIVGGLILRVFVSLDSGLHTWDERYHALVAKNLTGHLMKPTLYEHPVLPFPYDDWTHSNVW